MPTFRVIVLAILIIGVAALVAAPAFVLALPPRQTAPRRKRRSHWLAVNCIRKIARLATARPGKAMAHLPPDWMFRPPLSPTTTR